MQRHFGFLLMILLSLLLFSIGCGGNGDDDDAGDAKPDDDDATNDDDAADDDDDDDDVVDTVSSASPGRQSAVLTDQHGGWKKAECFSCHQDTHQKAFIEGECSACHGANGASYRPDGHENSGCAGCHDDSHPEAAFTENHCTACHSYDPEIECPTTETYDVAVIGAGGGGLAAAAALSLAGMKVVLLEKHYRVGGYMGRFHRGDFDFEISLHAINGLDDPADAQELVRLGIFDRLDPVKSDPLYVSYFPGGDAYTIPADIDEYRTYLKEQFPAETDGVDALFDELALMDLLLTAAMGISEEFNMDDLLTLVLNFQGTLRLASYMFVSLQDFMETFIDDPELIGLFTQLVIFLGDGPSDLQAVFFNAMWNSYHNRGYYYLTGGSGALTRTMADVIEENGGVIKVNTLVTQIVIEEGKATQVRTENDGCFDARYVVSNANAVDTLLSMVGEENLPPDYVADLNNMEICVPTTLQIYMGTDKDYREYFNGTHELVVNTSYDQDANYQFMYNADLENAPYLAANYSVVDPTVAPEGKNAISMATYLPMEWEDDWKWNEGYDPYLSFKENVAAVYIKRMEEYLPGLSDHIEVLEIGTPVTNHQFTLNPLGTIYGWRNTPEQGTLRRLKPQTPIENLILAGAWTFPGGGQMSVIGSGCTAADMILEMEGKRSR